MHAGKRGREPPKGNLKTAAREIRKELLAEIRKCADARADLVLVELFLICVASGSKTTSRAP